MDDTDISHTTCPHLCTASPNINISHQRGTFVTINKPTLIHHYHLKSLAYMRSHSWWCTFFGFGQKYNDLYSQL